LGRCEKWRKSRSMNQHTYWTGFFKCDVDDKQNRPTLCTEKSPNSHNMIRLYRIFVIWRCLAVVSPLDSPIIPTL
jgi:hypothetical protein